MALLPNPDNKGLRRLANEMSVISIAMTHGMSVVDKMMFHSKDKELCITCSSKSGMGSIIDDSVALYKFAEQIKHNDSINRKCKIRNMDLALTRIVLKGEKYGYRD